MEYQGNICCIPVIGSSGSSVRRSTDSPAHARKRSHSKTVSAEREDLT